MIKKLCAIGAILLLAASLAGQSSAAKDASYPWLIQFYKGDVKDSSAAINAMFARGYIPSGVELDSANGIAVTFSLNPAVKASNWALVAMKNSEVNARMADIMKQGYVPVDIAVVKDGLLVLALSFPTLKANAFRIVTTSDLQEDTIRQQFLTYKTLGYYPYGVSVVNESAYLLFVKVEASQYASYDFKTYKNSGDDFPKGMLYERGLGNDTLGFAFNQNNMFALVGKP